LVKTFGAKVTDQDNDKINNEIKKLNIDRSDFLRMLLRDYFKDEKLNKDIQVNDVNLPVNLSNRDDQYQTTIIEVDSFLKELNKDIKKQKSGN